MNPITSKTIFLADDDMDDVMIFEDALREIALDVKHTTVNDGVELMNMLSETVMPKPDVIFLDLNMPRKNGFECLDEIRNNPVLKDIPVVVFSTSSDHETVNDVYKRGANFYICKPASFPLLKKAISLVLSINWTANNAQPSREDFMLQFNERI